MFIHNFKYSFKTLLKDKSLIFWTFAFPIILGTLFNMAFSDIGKNEKLKTIDIAIIETEDFNNNIIYKSTFETLSSGEDQLFNTIYTNKEEANKLLKDKKIIGYLELNNEPLITTNKNGINETVFKYVVDEIEQTNSIVTNLSNLGLRQDEIYKNALSMLNSDIKLNDKSRTNLDYMMIEFYTLIAMTCLYGALLSMTSINKTLPNMSSVGKRINISPTNKFKIILSNLLSSYLIQLIGLFLLFIYTIFVLNIDYGNNLLLIILLSLIGSLAGLSLGLFISTICKTSENNKVGIIISISMVCVFLSGMMGVTMKYIIDKNIPILNKINPANMITDGFYSLYYYDTLDRYFTNIISLLIFSIILIIVSCISLRRQKYDSI